MINEKMKNSTSFYLKNRHLLQSLINSYNREKVLNDKLKKICQTFDQLYVNQKQQNFTQIFGEIQTKDQVEHKQSETQSSSQAQIKTTLKTSQQILYLKNQLKIIRAKFIQKRQDFILAINQISQKLLEFKQGNTQQEIYFNKQKLFVQELVELNQGIAENKKIGFQQTTDSLNNQKASSTLEQFLPKSQKQIYDSRGYTFYFKQQFYDIDSIILQKSSFIRTKNRYPLILNFGFSRFIYKNDDQLSHELIAMQMIKYLNKIFGKQYIKQYQIIPQIKGALYEFVQDSMTIAQIKKNHKDLNEYLKKIGQISQIEKFRKQFAQSYAGYCIAQYLLEIKDRNNANIMLKSDGTIFHIDLAFIFNSKPGGINFQSAPFKMTKQYVKLLGGFQSDHFKYFQSLLIQFLTKIYESRDEFFYKLQILSSRSKQIRCFNGFDLQKYKQIKMLKKLDNVKTFVQQLIDKSYDNWNTKKYDSYQFKVNNIPC